MNGGSGSGSGMYDSFLMDDVWNGIPCSELLALAEAAVTTKSSRIGGENETNMHFENQDYGSSMKPDSGNQIKDEQPGGRRYLFDLNLPPTVTEPQLITDISSQLTPKQTGGAGHSDGDGKIDQTADKQDDERFNLEQPQLIIEQSHDSDSMQLEVNGDFEEESSDDYNLKKTPQPKQRRRKHRPKVVIESQPKTAKKPPPPKPNASSTGKRKYVRKMKMVSEKSTATEGTNEATDLTAVRQTRNSCRRRINFEKEEQKLHTGQGTEKKTQMELKYDKAFESQSLSPITPDKSELKHEKREKDTPSRAKRGINFSRNDSNCSTSACFNETRGSKRGKENAFGSRGESLESYLSLINNNSIPGLYFPAIHKKKRTEKCQSIGTSRAVSSIWSPEAEDNDCRFHVMEVPETPTMYGASNRQSHKHMSAFGHVESFRKKRTKGLKRVRDLASFAGMMEVKQWPAHNGASRHKDSCKYHTCMEALAADFGSSIATKKRTKRKLIMLSSSYRNHSFLNNYTGFHPSLRWGSKYDLNVLINQFESLSMNERVVEQDQHALIPYKTRYQEKNALVLYQQDKSLVPFEGSYNPLRRRKPRPKVDLDDETSRVWRLLLEDINSKGIDGTDEDKEKWWEEERNVFSGRATSFIARMHLVQGDRRFSQWKGSVVDSVIGVFLTQNVSDHLSSSAFMSLAARYPLKSNSSNEPLQDDNSRILATFTEENRGVDELESIGTSHEQNEGVSHDHTTSGLGIPPKYHDWQTSHGSGPLEDEYNEMKEKRTILHKELEENCASEQSGISAESASQATVEMIKARSFQEALRSCNTLQSEGEEIFDCRTITDNSKIVNNQHVHENNCNVQKALSVENFSAEVSEVTESNNIMESSRETAHKVVETDSNEHGKLQTTESGIDEGGAEVKLGKTRKAKKIKADWDRLRISAEVKQKRERTPNTKDSLDYEAVRYADVHEIADTIKDRGMNNMLAERIKDFLNRLVKDHGSIDLEWLRDVPPDKAKEYLLSFRGLGLKSVECVRLLTLHHLAFPVDTNVGRIAVRLGWVPLQPLPESLQLHLLELYPVLESIQKYLWPRLCKLDQRTLYELHYQMITFGKVFCTKNKPNCNACPMRGECRHFASAFASARLTLPAPEEKSIVSATQNKTPDENPTGVTNQRHLTLPPANQYLQQQSEGQVHDPVIEEPGTPEPVVEVPATPEPEMVQQEFDIEDFCEDPEEIPMIRLNMEAFTQNLQTYMENNMELAEGDMSRALVALTSEAASIPTPKLKNVSQLRTEHQVYELPDSHPLLEGLDKREPDDPCSYLLAIWTPGETAESIEPPEGKCSSQESGMLCHKETCFLCNSIREANSQIVRGTLLIPCRTAMRGSFPLNGTYFQVNEVFADHDSSLNPIDVPRSWLWNLPRRTVYFGTSIPTIFKGLTTEGIQYCFWRGFVCVRGFDQKTRSPRPLMARLHFPASKLRRSRGKADEN